MIQAVSAYSGHPPHFLGAIGNGARPVFGQDTHTGYTGHDYSPPPPDMNLLQQFGEWAIRQYQRGPIGRFIHDKVYKAINLKCLYAETGSSSCSQYTLNQLRSEGFFKGCIKGFGRILNCNPFSMRNEKMRQWFRDDVPRLGQTSPFQKTGSGRRYIPSYLQKDLLKTA